ncbi:OLC1v1012252C1 [Oldenlandia corymbosa var. corymbosa]|uniref:OLC1v1012252C1 n=1 Tax=Oldenlandia corymbosa var. corymbosa TaxID=529605 RepID=A0AAV1DVN1_OLDCO|nr:OLC1v1012252C1 [Oldenlandia corymbosa var. corymbosa]
MEPLSTSGLSQVLCGGSRLLKVLDLEGTDLEEIPKEVFKLFHLRTLNLKRTRLKVIPRSIGCLRNLEYLDVSYTNVSALPKELLKVKGLIHLNVFQCNESTRFVIKGFQGQHNISKLSSLEWLFCIEANETMIKEIGKLKNLKILAITILRREDEKHFCFSIGNLTKLRGLVPKLVSCLKGLMSVALVSSKLINDPLESLQYLPNLRALMLEQAYEGESLWFKSGCFLELDNLTLVKLHNLKILRMEEGGMPNLRMLAIISLQSLQEFPWGVQHLIKLQYLYLELMSDEVIVQLRNQYEESEDYQKISHILQILIWDHQDGWLLKVLNLEGTDLEEIPKEVFKLFHLRTLNLKCTRVKIVPRSIGSLKNLEFLDLSYTNVSPNNISKLSSLEWLLCMEVNETQIKEIGKLKKLKTLVMTILRRGDEKHLFVSLGKLTNLRELFLQAEFPLGVQHLTKLQHLYLELMSDKVTVELQNQDEESGNYQKISHILQILIWGHKEGIHSIGIRGNKAPTSLEIVCRIMNCVQQPSIYKLQQQQSAKSFTEAMDYGIDDRSTKRGVASLAGSSSSPLWSSNTAPPSDLLLRN